MAIILSQDHPAFSRLQKIPGVAVKSEETGAPVVDLGFVNQMPENYLDETLDLFLACLSKSHVDVRPTFISPEGNLKKGACWGNADKSKLDCFLITGYAKSDFDFDKLEFAPCLRTILDYAKENNRPVFASCAGGMFTANHYYKIAKEQAPHKLLGNYDYRTQDGQNLYLATSRNNTLNRRDLLRALSRTSLRIANETTQTPQPEPGVLVDSRHNLVIALAHLEYSNGTRDDYPDFENQPLDIMTYQYLRDHNEESDKYDPVLAARVFPPVHTELTAQQVDARESYADRLFSGWIERTHQLKLAHTWQAEQEVRPVARRALAM